MRRVELFVVEARSAEHQKAPQAGSHKSLMFPAKGKELFYHKGCKFTFQGVDQTRRRSLTLQAGFGFAPNGSSRPMQIKKRSISLPLCKTELPFWNLRCKSLSFSAKLRRFACKPELKDDGWGGLARKTSTCQPTEQYARTALWHSAAPSLQIFPERSPIP